MSLAEGIRQHHLRAGDPRMIELLKDGQVLVHPWVIGQLALGDLSPRVEVLALLRNLPRASVAADRGFADG